MSKQPEDKATLRKQLDQLIQTVDDLESDKTLDEAARKQVANAAREAIKVLEEKLAEMP